MKNLSNKFQKLKKTLSLNKNIKKSLQKEIVYFAKHTVPQYKTLEDRFISWKYKIAWATASAILLIILIPTTISLANNANPGHPFYALKRFWEKIELKLTKDPKRKESIIAKLTQLRIQELEKTIVFDEEKNQLLAIKEVRNTLKKLQTLPPKKKKRLIKILTQKIRSLKLRIKSKRVLNSLKTLEDKLVVKDDLQSLPIITPHLTPVINRKIKKKKTTKDLFPTPIVTKETAPSPTTSVELTKTKIQVSIPTKITPTTLNVSPIHKISPKKVKKSSLIK